MENILETQALCKVFRGQKANDEISIHVKKNTIYGLLGPNGAGKSTLLKMLTGMQQPSAGEILFEGYPMKRTDLAYIGAFIEEPPVYENLTARENLKVRTLMYDMPDERIDEVLKIVKLEDTGKKKAGKFSMGMKQRLGIAIALLNRPKLLILDEPTNGLDPIGVMELREFIKSLPEKGITVIVSSHILAEIQQVADHIGIIVKGRLWYEEAVGPQINLESLFLEIVRKGA